MKIGAEEQKTIILTVLVGLLSVVAFYNFSLRPNFKNLKTLASQVSKLKTEIKSINKEIAGIKNLQKQFENMQKQSELAAKGFLKDRDYTSLMEEISRIAKDERIKIVNMGPVKDKTPDDKKQAGQRLNETQAQQRPSSKMAVAEVAVSVSIKGGYHNIGRFINGLENSQLLINVKDLDIAANYSDSLNHNAALLITAYALSE